MYQKKRKNGKVILRDAHSFNQHTRKETNLVKHNFIY